MRIRDWSSDVCSSDLLDKAHARKAQRQLAIVVAKFADAIFGPENREAARSLDADFVVHMAKIEEVGAGDHERPLRWGQGHHARTPRRARLQRRGRPITRGYISRSEEHTSELQSLMRISYAVFCLKQKKNTTKIS